MPDFVNHKVPGANRRDLEADVFQPAGTANGVAVILLHGGGWAHGHRAATYGYAAALAAQGFVAVAAEYRLLPEAAWPAQIDDVRDVVRWVKSQADTFGVDQDKVALIGFSAGAHLALITAGTQPGSGNEGAVGADPNGSDVAAVVSFFAPVRLDANPAALAQPPFSILLAGGGLDAAKAASPIYYLNDNFPSTFILGGMADYMQPLGTGLELLDAMVKRGLEVEFHYFHSQVHEFCSTPAMLGKVMEEVGFYLRRTLLDRDAVAADAREHNMFARASSMSEFAAMMAASR